MTIDLSDSIADLASAPAPHKPVRVLHVNAGNLYGGVESLLATLATLRQIAPSMVPHFAVCFQGQSSEELVRSGAPVHVLSPVRISRPWTAWRARRQLRQLLEKERFDVVVCHMAWTLAIFGPVVRNAGIKLVAWCHGFHSPENWLERIARRIKPDLVIANSQFTAATAREHFSNRPVEVLYCPVVLAGTEDAEQQRIRMRRELGASDDTAVILQVGRLDPLKGHLAHFQALSQLHTSRQWMCWIAGGAQNAVEEQYLENLRAAARELGLEDRVRFLGQRNDVAKLMVAADIFCQPNQRADSFGLVFVEALWAGRPVVSTELGGALEIVDHSCGLLVKPSDIAGLSRALERLIESEELRTQLGAAGPARARQLCDPTSQMKALNTLLHTAASGSDPRAAEGLNR